VFCVQSSRQEKKKREQKWFFFFTRTKMVVVITCFSNYLISVVLEIYWFMVDDYCKVEDKGKNYSVERL